MRIALVTLGCRTNQAETFRLERAIREARHEIVGRPDEADLCIINTCTVTGKADLQSRQVIRRALRKGKRVIATGCFTELNRPEMGDCGGDLTLVPNDKKDDIIKLIGEAQPGKTAVIAKEGRKRPVIKVQDGCDHSCSYCVVPAARGRSRSSAVSDVLSEIALCEEEGYNEIVLSGIHLGMYGRDHDPGETLSSLLENILLRCRIPRIRLSSLEISEIDERLLEVLTNERICRHLHVPLQSGSDNILKSMNRSYTARSFIDT
ncbi:MAG TPA: radical SAM protein, partial [Dissulfurispiraceae bacterium]|nr:radical SAM protein [Dissulfurispiraceae bacterium]